MLALTTAPRARFNRDIEIPFFAPRAPQQMATVGALNLGERVKDPMFLLFSGVGAAGLWMLFTGSALIGGAAIAVSAFYLGAEIYQ